MEDIEIVKQHKWSFDKRYVSSAINKKTILIHRFLLNAKKGEIVDHKNRKPLDNRKNNLRICTTQENNSNVNIGSRNVSGIIGVFYNEKRNKWISKLNKNGKAIHFCRFNNKEDAIKSRLQAEIKYYGEFAPQRHLFEQYNIKESN